MTTYSLWGSNPRPMAHKTIALTTELREPCCKPQEVIRNSLASDLEEPGNMC